jgi:hypothetical protein
MCKHEMQIGINLLIPITNEECKASDIVTKVFAWKCIVVAVNVNCTEASGTNDRSAS